MAERRKIGFGTILMVILAVCVVAYVVSAMRTAGDIPYLTAQDYKRRGPGSRQQGLPEIIHGMLLPTPVATEIHHAERVRKWKSMNLSSPHAQIAGEKNPNGLTDFLDFYGILPEPIPDNTELENTDGNNLEESILQWLAEGQVMPTPTARDWKGAPSLENLKKRGKIPQKNSLRSEEHTSELQSH